MVIPIAILHSEYRRTLTRKVYFLLFIFVVMSFEGKLPVILISIFLLPLEGITVKPARCPTNKIAPHKRSPYYGHLETRTFGGAFYDLLSPGGVQYDPASSLQERPQEDPDDCGDIEDYDETDLSSLTEPSMRQNNNRFFLGLFRPGQHQSTTRPTPTRPTFTPTPPYWSGGYFGNNHYRPPLQQEPSAHVKPVHEGPHETHSTYRPEIVGGPLGHVVGHYPVRPTTRPPSDYTTQNRRPYHTRYPPGTTEATVHTTRPARPRMFNNEGILGSFIDLLLFK